MESSQILSERTERLGDEDKSPEERRKRPLDVSGASTRSNSAEPPSKRGKGDANGSDDRVAADDQSGQSTRGETTPGPLPSGPSFIPTSPEATPTIVRQSSVMSGLEDTESAARSATQRDSIIRSLSDNKRAKIVNTALYLISDEGVSELRHFLHDARAIGTDRSKNLVRDVDSVTTRPGLVVPHTSKSIVSRDDALSYFSALNTDLDGLDRDETKTIINKRMKLAAMAEYRKCLVPERAGQKTRAGIANLNLFRAIYPNHDMIARPDEEPNISAARRDWNRLRDRLKQGRLW
jgi:hypothetical protein